MAARIAVFVRERQLRSAAVCRAAVAGIRAIGAEPMLVDETFYRTPVGDAAVFYGLQGRLPMVLHDYPAVGKPAVYVDLGYWGRRDGPDRFSGYHKLCVNDRHPVHFQRRIHDGSRFSRFGIRIEPWRRAGRRVLVAGMSAKAARSLGMVPGRWEEEVVAALRRLTDREIVYRPKPNCRESRPIEGATTDDGELAAALEDCHAVVTHHSNIAVDAILAGVPAFCWAGVAAPMSGQDLAMIEDPPHPCGRAQWAADIAWTQFNIAEIASGLAFLHLREEGLLP